MTWEDYKRIDRTAGVAVGILADHYVLERSIQSGTTSDFYILSKEEYESYHQWWKDADKIMNIRLRKAWCRGFLNYSEFRVFETKVEDKV